MLSSLINTPESIYQTLLKFCRVKSVTDSEGEKEAPQFLYEELNKLPYFQKNPKHLSIQPIQGDRLGRSNLYAWIKAEKPVAKTIILMGHFDVVDTDVCGNLKAEAFDPVNYTKLMENEDISEEARIDLESGKWIFGRGTADMKCGLIVQAAVLEEFSRHPELLDVNLLFMAVADEENNACGIQEGVRYLAKLKKEGYEFLCCIDSEPSITLENKECAWIHLGTIGMYTPFTFVLGRETHVGEYFEGLPASLIAFKLGGLLEGSSSFAETFKEVTYPPLTCLKVYDLKPTYSVTVIERIAMYYNSLFVTMTPDELQAMMKTAAKIALGSALEDYHKSWLEKRTHSEKKQFNPQVIEYRELAELAERKSGISKQKMASEFLNSLPNCLELQDRGIRLVNHLVDAAGLIGPAVIIGFLPPYCPSGFNERKTAQELKIIETVEQLVVLAKNQYHQSISIGEIYEGISDLSEFAYKGTARDIHTLSRNFPGWGTDFEYPFEQSKYLDIPVVNLGPIGKDAHKKTERLYLPYALEVLPKLLKEMIERIAN
ncbi:M20/M25/M40 family metallo-hydrolase [Bacillus sp. BRMEA1]|uniref:M20/M25/M40 family metallo-hydrolase n=1 Tax=Neobacillus endophyticus TaxID=2738405 RepID=UPI001566EA2E|nr:M20/M25/M40 family metallo-hydrolase [Neobacillus endophyticus]NRD77851.1 M20/M25/M40 family metallo-hydrolase [Neobacillus endophyticus]